MLARISRTALRTASAASRSIWLQQQPILRSAVAVGSFSGRSSVRAQSSVADADDDVNALELEHALANEIEFEESSKEGEMVTSEQLEGELKEAFPEFTVSIDEGRFTVTLQRKVGDRSVVVELDACNQDTWGNEEGEEEQDALSEQPHEEEEAVHVLSATVTISRAGKPHKLLCTIGVPVEDAAGVEVTGVSVIPSDWSVMDAENSTVYAPPVYSELDVGLQSSFLKFLHDHGVDDEFADGVRAVADRKEQFEYVRWLKGVHAVVEGTAAGPNVIDA